MNITCNCSHRLVEYHISFLYSKGELAKLDIIWLINFKFSLKKFKDWI